MNIPDYQIRVTVEKSRETGMHCGVNVPGVMVEHIPSGLVAACRSERSVMKNTKTALEMIEWGLASTGWTQRDLDAYAMSEVYSAKWLHASEVYANKT